MMVVYLDTGTMITSAIRVMVSHGWLRNTAFMGCHMPPTPTSVNHCQVATHLNPSILNPISKMGLAGSMGIGRSQNECPFGWQPAEVHRMSITSITQLSIHVMILHHIMEHRVPEAFILVRYIRSKWHSNSGNS
jgi:hypothetical protein